MAAKTFVGADDSVRPFSVDRRGTGGAEPRPYARPRLPLGGKVARPQAVTDEGAITKRVSIEGHATAKAAHRCRPTNNLRRFSVGAAAPGGP